MYQAAELGKGFKVKKFVVKDANVYPIQVWYDSMCQSSPVLICCRTVILLPKLCQTPCFLRPLVYRQVVELCKKRFINLPPGSSIPNKLFSFHFLCTYENIIQSSLAFCKKVVDYGNSSHELKSRWKRFSQPYVPFTSCVNLGFISGDVWTCEQGWWWNWDSQTCQAHAVSQNECFPTEESHDLQQTPRRL